MSSNASPTDAFADLEGAAQRLAGLRGIAADASAALYSAAPP